MFFPPYFMIILFNTRYLENHNEARTMASASARSWSWPHWLPLFYPMAALRSRPWRCIEQHKAQLANLTIWRSRYNSHPIIAPLSASTVQADPDQLIIPDQYGCLTRLVCDFSYIYRYFKKSWQIVIPHHLMGQWFKIWQPGIRWRFKLHCWSWNPQLHSKSSGVARDENPAVDATRVFHIRHIGHIYATIALILLTLM